MTLVPQHESYTPQMRLWDLITDNSALLMAISRFGIPLGFGNATVQEVCRKNNVHCDTLLAIANYLSRRPFATENLSLSVLMDYLRGSHTYFLEFLLPQIRRKLIEAVNYGNSDNEVSMLLLKFFDEYVEEIRSHMTYENDNVFPYIEALLRGDAAEGERPDGLFTDRHDDVALKLQELMDIMVRYYPRRNSDIINSALSDIINCERQILEHCTIEDLMFEPAVREIERRIGGKQASRRKGSGKDPEPAAETLSQREKEIIRLVACGLSNKEIADKLFLSVHTVTTHRRNISAKLDIHSPAALTIYAVINHIVSIDDVKELAN